MEGKVLMIILALAILAILIMLIYKIMVPGKAGLENVIYKLFWP